MERSRRAFLAAAGGGLTALSREAFARLRALPSASPETAAQDEDFWFRIRDSFTIDRNSVNLNSGSVSPAPRTVQTAMHQYWDITNMSPSYYVDEMLGPRVEVVRRRLAGAFGCDPEEMAITRNTSESMEIVQLGLDLKRGDEVLTTTQDYPRMLTAWRQREARDGIVVKTVSFPTPPEGPDAIVSSLERAITPRTRVILICHVTYTTGQIFPVKAICAMARERGIETLVDGAHGFAHFPFTRDDLDCDYYATSLHKWLYAPVGTGFLYVRRSRIRDLWPLMAAPLSMRDDIRKFEEIGTHPIAIKGAITEALTFHDGIGAERKAARLQFLRRRWSDRVRDLPGVR
ncbi:MAG TPA: aminotransferase class V-fold PLP-dependent enzyme, partial [Vicinamibacteria bacterium]|nr:aminotransferase class V-fold PLP-dependent enzyme [Vicinamibacteria bacterium]